LELSIQNWTAQRVLDRKWSASVDAETERVTGIASCDAPKPGADNFDTGYWGEWVQRYAAGKTATARGMTSMMGQYSIEVGPRSALGQQRLH